MSNITKYVGRGAPSSRLVEELHSLMSLSHDDLQTKLRNPETPFFTQTLIEKILNKDPDIISMFTRYICASAMKKEEAAMKNSDEYASGIASLLSNKHE